MSPTMDRRPHSLYRVFIALAILTLGYQSSAGASLVQGNFSGNVIAKLGNAVSLGAEVDGDFSYFVDQAVSVGGGMHLLDEAISSLSLRVEGTRFDYTFQKQADISQFKSMINAGIGQVKNLINNQLPNVTTGMTDNISKLADQAIDSTGKIVTLSNALNANIFAMGGLEITDSMDSPVPFILPGKIPTAAQLLGIMVAIPGLSRGEMPTSAEGTHLGLGFVGTGNLTLQGLTPKLDLDAIGFTINQLNIGDPLITVPLPSSMLLSLSGAMMLFIGFTRRRTKALAIS